MTLETILDTVIIIEETEGRKLDVTNIILDYQYTKLTYLVLSKSQIKMMKYKSPDEYIFKKIADYEYDLD